MTINELFWAATNEEREIGYCLREETYHCLLCDYQTKAGYVFPKGQEFVDAKKQMSLHITEEHGGVFESLIHLDKKLTGLSPHQSTILKLFYQGISDYEVQQTLNIGSISTVRNHRYAMKEKEKQAKTIVTIMSLLNQINGEIPAPIKPHKTATMADNRYDVTLEESLEIINKYFPNGTEAPLLTFNVKEKYKIILLREIIKKFTPKRLYKERDVDLILKQIYPDDHALIRRYMIQYGFMSRERDGSAYWVKEMRQATKMKKKNQVNDSRKKELIQAYKAKTASEDIETGVYQIKNLINNKLYIGTSRNIKKLNGLSFQLNMGTFMNKSLQNDWTNQGEKDFTIDILESFIEDETPTAISRKLHEMEYVWKEKLKPYGDRGYHKKSNNRKTF